MGHMGTSSSILSPFTNHLPAQPLIIGDIPFPRDAGTFVKALQSMVLKVCFQFGRIHNLLIIVMISLQKSFLLFGSSTLELK